MVSFGVLCIANRYHWEMNGVSDLLRTNDGKRTHRMMMVEIEMEDMIRWTASYAVAIRWSQTAATLDHRLVDDVPDTPFLPTRIP